LSGIPFFHLPNPGEISPGLAGRFRKLGGSSPEGSPLLGGTGVPDLILPVHREALELKAPGGAERPAQRVWREQLTAAGWRCAVVVGYDAALEQLRAWGHVLRLSPLDP